MKLIFDKLATFTMNVGKKVIQFGKKIIELVIFFAKSIKINDYIVVRLNHRCVNIILTPIT
tara:strand:- start:57 stop:239 length:183 start_codon:yes stop_codon:yes gene_type:complete